MNALAFGLLSFSSLFTIIDPLGVAPLFVGLTRQADARERRRMAVKACLVALGLLVVFAVCGSLILKLFGITIHAFRIAGGILFFSMAAGMLTGHHRPQPSNDTEGDPAVVPLGMPLICGPGALSTVMVLMGQATSGWHVASFFAALLLTLSLTLAVLLAAPAALRLLGKSGVQVVTQVMGLILCVIGVQFIVDGVRPLVLDMLNLTRGIP
ncbi:MAG: MarC family protein [Candidatus Eremiobacterota bacterium]